MTTAMLLGRFQPFHDGHKALALEAIRRVGHVCIMPRTMPIDERSPLTIEQVCERIHNAMAGHSYTVLPVPNITHVYYGRDVGYAIEYIELPQDVQLISATKLREAGL